MNEDGPQAKRERNDDEDGEEMEIEDDDESPKQAPASASGESWSRGCFTTAITAMCRNGGYAASRELPISAPAMYELAPGGHGRRAIRAIPTVRLNPLHLATLTS